MNPARWLPWVLAIGTAGGCTYASPVRGAISGAPGRLRAGETSVTASGSYNQAPPTGALHVSHAFTDESAIESGIEYMHGDGKTSWSMMASVGGRFTGRAREDEEVQLAGDIEMGVGAGVGGWGVRDPYDERHASPPRWYTRPAGGGYWGLGGAVSYRWFAWFVRARAQVSVAKGIGLNTWLFAATGPEFRLGDHAFLHCAYVPITSFEDVRNGLLVHAWELGLTFKFGPRRRRGQAPRIATR